MTDSRKLTIIAISSTLTGAFSFFALVGILFVAVTWGAVITGLVQGAEDAEEYLDSRSSSGLPRISDDQMKRDAQRIQRQLDDKARRLLPANP